MEVNVTLASGPELFLGGQRFVAGETTSLDFTPHSPALEHAGGTASPVIRRVDDVWWINATIVNPEAAARRVRFECLNGFAEQELQPGGSAVFTCATGNAFLPPTAVTWRVRTLYDAWLLTDAGLLLPSTSMVSPTSPATQEVSSSLKVLNVYGVRKSTMEDISSIFVNTELAAGSIPVDLTKLIVRYSDGTNVHTYAYGSPGFSPTWIRGTNNSGIMSEGDLVEIGFELPSNLRLPPRTSVQLDLIPETGSPVQADFKTPATYGTDTTITLR
jgi:archaellin